MGWWPFRNSVPDPTNNGDTGLSIRLSTWPNDYEQTMFATLQIKMVGRMHEVEGVKKAFEKALLERK